LSFSKSLPQLSRKTEGQIHLATLDERLIIFLPITCFRLTASLHRSYPQLIIVAMKFKLYSTQLKSHKKIDLPSPHLPLKDSLEDQVEI